MINSEYVIIFKDPNPYDDVNYGFLYPANGWEIDFIAEKDVPFAMPYMIVSQSLVPPAFPNEKDFYVVDFSNPDGFGSGSYSYEYMGENGSTGVMFESPFHYDGTFNYNRWKKTKGIE